MAVTSTLRAHLISDSGAELQIHARPFGGAVLSIIDTDGDSAALSLSPEDARDVRDILGGLLDQEYR